MEAAVRWSPFSVASGRERFLLVDVGDQSLTLNQITARKGRDVSAQQVAKYGRLPNFGAFDWSKTDERIVALGLVSGSACLVRLDEDARKSDTIATFRLKQQRKCNSIALSAQNWLAVALDKTRSDVCLNIYDATDDTLLEPIRRLCPAEVVSSVRFFPQQPQELVVAAQRACVRLYDLRDGYFGSSNALQAATRNVNNIAIDPADPNYFASAGSSGDPAVTVWDKRWISQTSSSGAGAVFELRPTSDDSPPATIWSLRYSGQTRGRLAICTSRGELQVLDMVEGRRTSFYGTDYPPQNPYGGTPWSDGRYVSHTRRVARPYEDGIETGPKAQLIAFDWIAGGRKTSEQEILALRPNRRVDTLRVPLITALSSVTARHDVSLAFDDITIADAGHPESGQDYQEVNSAEDFGPVAYEPEAVEDGSGDAKAVHVTEASQLSTLSTYSTISRERCRSGYLFDCERNMKIVRGTWALERLWETIGRFCDQAADSGMISKRQQVDLSFVGVAAVCSEKIGRMSARHLSSIPGQVESAIADLNASRGLPPFEGERTSFPEHRQLCLEMCGWKFALDELEAECQDLVERGLYYQAIVQAVLHERKHIALNMLRSLIRSKTVPNIGLGALLASDRINDAQREMCLWMTADAADPALKALLTFLTNGDWRDVMKTTYLHLGYRIALGLKYLNDTELRGFIQTETARAVKNGDLEGVLLTGLGEQAMDLFQTYVSKTNDLQTAVLATAFTNPGYVHDIRWEMWKETYLMQMQSWRAFTQRTNFVVRHGHMARSRGGGSLLEAIPSQVTLRCEHCRLSLAKYDGGTSTRHTGGVVASNTKGTGATSASSGLVCPKCGRHMPRCAICKMWLGTPDPQRRGGAKELQKLDKVIARFVTFCVSCEHASHADHASTWFEKHQMCPVPGCQCLCTMK